MNIQQRLTAFQSEKTQHKTSPVPAGLMRASFLSMPHFRTGRALVVCALILPTVALCQESTETFASTGTLSMVVSDDFVHLRSTTRWLLSAPEGMFNITSPPRPDWRSGQSVKVRGALRSGTIEIQTIDEAAVSVTVPACSTIGPQNIAVLMLTTPSNQTFPPAFTAASLQEAFWGSSSDNSSTQSLNGYWQEMSYGRASVVGQVFGPFPLSQDYSAETEFQMATEAINMADATVDFSKFTRIALVFPQPPVTGTSWNPNSTIGCTTITSPTKGTLPASIAWLPAYLSNLPNDSPPVAQYAHELGHGLGLNHSSSDDYGTTPLGPLNTPGQLVEYGDPYSVMAYPDPYGLPTGQYVAEHKALVLQWLQPGDYIQVSASGVYTLAPYETSGMRALRVLRNANTGAWLWVEYRQPIGDIDSDLQNVPSTNVYGGALIHYEDPNLDSPRHTYLVDLSPVSVPNNFATAVLTPGNTWSDPSSPLSLTVNSATPDGLTITIGYSSSPGSPPAPPANPCAFRLAGASQNLSALGDSGLMTVTVSSGCSWNAVSTTSWLTISSGGSAGSGVADFSVSANATGSPRTGFLMVGGQGFPVTQSGAASISPGGVFSADTASSVIQPGTWISIYGVNLANMTVTWNGDFPTILGGASVTINSKPAYLSYVSPTQINLQAPSDIASGPVPVVIATVNGTLTATVNLMPLSPALLLLDGEHVAGIILRPDGSGAYGSGNSSYDILGPTGNSLGYPTVSAKAGDTVELYGIGFGPTNPFVPAGQAFSGAAPATNPVQLLINNVNVTPSFAGITSAGLYQVNLTLPVGLGAGNLVGDVPIEALLGGAHTQSGVYISVSEVTEDAPYVQSLTFPSPVRSGIFTGTVTLSAPAPAQGAIVQLSSGLKIAPPSNVTVPAGATATTFTLEVGAVCWDVVSFIQASYGGGTARSTVTIKPPASGSSFSTLAPGGMLQMVFSSVPNTSDELVFFNNDALTSTGSPLITTTLFNGSNLLGSTTAAPSNDQGAQLYQAAFTSSTSSTTCNGVLVCAQADLSSLQNGTIQGLLTVTVEGGSISGFCGYDFGYALGLQNGSLSYGSSDLTDVFIGLALGQP